MATRYKLSKDQLERVVENFVMEAASAKATVKNHIPSQGSEAKKHVKNKISGKIVDKSEGMPSVTPMKKKLSHAPESKKFVSNSKMTHSNKAKIVKENELEEGWFGNLIGTKMSEENATKMFETKYKNKLKDIIKYLKIEADEETVKKAIIKAMMETGASLRLNKDDEDRVVWNSEKNEFIKNPSKSGGAGGVVGG
jgi:surface antigen